MSKVVSYLLHPLLMPTYLFLTIIGTAPMVLKPLEGSALYRLLIIVFIISFLMPMLSMVTLRFSSYISSFHLNDRKERIVPFVFVTIFYGIAAYIFHTKIRFNDFFYISFIVVTALLIVLTIITFYWKISIHSAGIWGAFGILYALQLKYPIIHLQVPIALTALAAGFVMSARLALQSHDSRQVSLGGLTGFILCFITTFFLLP